jgi:predicted SAM-dependent methyltransferase
VPKTFRSIGNLFTQRLPPKLHFFLVQPFSQTPKFFKTLRYHSGLYRDAGRDFAGLHLGSGNSRIEGFCNIDGNPLLQCDLVSGLEKLKLNSDSVDIIYASHVFEHIPRAGTTAVLKEWRRVLKPEGRLYLCVPDVEALFKIYLENLPHYDTEAGRSLVDVACGIAYGGQVDRYDFHFYGYSFATLKALLESAGFKDVQRFSSDDANFDLPIDGHTAAISGVPISLNVRADKCSR